MTARVVGGLLSLDGMIFVGGETNFDMQVTLANADLDRRRPPACAASNRTDRKGLCRGTHLGHGAKANTPGTATEKSACARPICTSCRP